MSDNHYCECRIHWLISRVCLKQKNTCLADQLALIWQAFPLSNLKQFLWQSVWSILTRYSVFSQPSWTKPIQCRADGYDITDGSGECLTGARGSRPLLVFIGVSVRRLAAYIPLPVPTQWSVSAAFLCLCPLSEMQPGLGKSQDSAKRLALCSTDSQRHVGVFSWPPESVICLFTV